VGADVVAQSPDDNIAYGKAMIDHGTSWKQAATSRAQAISDQVSTLGDVYAPYIDTWHQTTKPAVLAAHHSYGDACISLGQAHVGDGVAFTNAEQDNVGLISSVSPEGTAGPSGTVT
jgi:hypothetical protein